MKKVNVREFQKTFSKVARELGQGETVEVTRHGKQFGFFIKAPKRAPSKLPDFAANLANLAFIGKAGEKILAEIVNG